MKFEILQNGEVIETKELGEGSWKIGRASECDIRLKSTQVSKQHAMLVIKGNKAAIVDVGSSNGVFVNGILVRKQRIDLGDEVAICEYQLRLARASSRPAGAGRGRAAASANGEPGFAMGMDGNAALDMGFEPSAAPSVEPEQVVPPPQERFLQLMDQKVLFPFYELMKTMDWRWMLSSILLISLVASVLLSVIPIVRWGKTITSKEALARAHTIVSQTVRENYRILSKTNDFTRLTVEACEAEPGVLACYIVDPKTAGVLAPSKLFNKSVTEVYSVIAMKRVMEGKEELVSVQKDEETVYIVAQPIHMVAPDTNERTVTAIVLATFEITDSITSTFEPMVEAALFAVLLSLGAYFFIYKMVTRPVILMQEQMDAALKGENVIIQCESRFTELENLAQNINFSISRLRQAGGGSIGAVSANDPEGEDNSYIRAIESLDYVTSDAIVLLTRENKVKFVGKALEDMIGMRNQYAQGQNISDACKDPAFAGTAIDLAERVQSTLGEPQSAQLDINGINRSIGAVGHKNSVGEIRFVLVVVKLGGQG